MSEKKQNHLKDQTSPYLLQHADNPVDWYPWCDEAFERAKSEDKPIFLSIGYSTCHWCHVMAHESFEDEEIAKLLNQNFVSIKVDKEERPDIDNIYMKVCQAFTGGGGWPTTIFMTPEQKPFFAGTYFPPRARYGQPGLMELLLAVSENWQSDREEFLRLGEEIISDLAGQAGDVHDADEQLIEKAYGRFQRSFDKESGGFGRAPKFPTPHNLLFLLQYYEKSGEKEALHMAEKTLLQMYRGGMYDHIGGGFCRYSTDRYFLVPHFEKMLYDNALLILAYCRLYQLSSNPLYLDIAKQTAAYVLREMTSPEGGFYSAQDADSEGEEGKYYLFEPGEILRILGEQEGEAFNRYYDITPEGNFEGRSIPNLLKNEDFGEACTDRMESRNVNMHDREDHFDSQREAVYEYRKNRYRLHLDDKILTSWNALMIAAMSRLYRVSKDETYLKAAVDAEKLIRTKLCEGDTLYVSIRDGRRGKKGFLDDYANVVFALIHLYEATLKQTYLERAQLFCEKILGSFYDGKQGGFFLYGSENEQLILRPKQTYDEAIFSGNSAMAYNLVQLYVLTGEEKYKDLAEKQLGFMSGEAAEYPAGYTMFLTALSDYCDPADKVVVVLKGNETDSVGVEYDTLPCKLPLSTAIRVLEKPTGEYPLRNGKTTYYVCRGRSCQPPVNEL